MSDDTSIRAPQDASRIALTEDYEVRYWTRKFGVTEEQLRAAVQEVGHSADRVEHHLSGSTQ
ncbi:DUF3606 domain-containing protein [Sphingomonas crocodyli]|uniref:DUF3606 domain-containing protein n=1 Tax=Sphingomonas crocodyli TaxID=1979270 RepID=A0A437LYA1_9SPHN|nr:DUF3606 domain-containing protein [Sphingomonas crocodyli]RVT90390.1 DUF3606 domain-containing protein [Sphingomonas crocodyli]